MLEKIKAWPSGNPWKLAIISGGATFATMKFNLITLLLSMI
jgi:hypothetical protein